MTQSYQPDTPRKGNPIRIEGDMAILRSPSGAEFVIDVKNLPRVGELTWFVRTERLAGPDGRPRHSVTACYRAKRNAQKAVTLGRFLVGSRAGHTVCFRNGNDLDFRESNLDFRLSGDAQADTGPRERNKTGYKGVCFLKSTGDYLAKITHRRETRRLGRCDTAKAAARLYDRAADEIYGAGRGFRNFPGEGK